MNPLAGRDGCWPSTTSTSQSSSQPLSMHHARCLEGQQERQLGRRSRSPRKRGPFRASPSPAPSSPLVGQPQPPAAPRPLQAPPRAPLRVQLRISDRPWRHGVQRGKDAAMSLGTARTQCVKRAECAERPHFGETHPSPALPCEVCCDGCVRIGGPHGGGRSGRPPSSAADGKLVWEGAVEELVQVENSFGYGSRSRGASHVLPVGQRCLWGFLRPPNPFLVGFVCFFCFIYQSPFGGVLLVSYVCCVTRFALPTAQHVSDAFCTFHASSPVQKKCPRM